MTDSLFQRLRGERGAAMTEFIVTLPLFIGIFGGMGMLYKYSNEALVARMKTNQILVDKSTAPNTVAGFVPSAAISMPTSFGTLTAQGAGANGMYADSWAKAGMAENLIPGAQLKNPAIPVKKTIQQITGMNSGVNAANSFTNFLMNDLATPTWDASGWAEILTSVVSTFGVAPSLAAGIRYEPQDAHSTHQFSHPWTGSWTYDPGTLEIAAPTASHHRAAAVAAARIAMNTREPYKKCLLEFNTDMCMDGNPASSTQTQNNSNAMDQLEQDATECSNQNDIWQACLNQCGVSPPSWPTASPFLCTNCDCYCDGDKPASSCQNLTVPTPSAPPSWGGSPPNTGLIP